MWMSGRSGYPRGVCRWSCSCPWGDDLGPEGRVQRPRVGVSGVQMGTTQLGQREEDQRKKRSRGLLRPWVSASTSVEAKGAHHGHQHPSSPGDPEWIPLLGPTLWNRSWSEPPKQWHVHYEIV